jgi:hypothetical protein
MENQTELSNIQSKWESDVNTLPDEETLNNEPEYIPEPNPWDDAPTGVWFYDVQYEDGHLGNMTQSAERAYKRGWDLSQNIPIEDVEVSDVNGFYYPKELCPMKTEQDLLKDQYRLEIQQLKKQLSDTDYKAIKYAEGQISEEEYASVRELRQSYRDRINELEALL